MSIIVKRIVKNKSLPVIKKEENKYTDLYKGGTYSRLEELVSNNIPEGDESEYSVKLGNLKFSYTTQQLPHCCGIIELGNLNLIPNGDKTTELTKYLDLLVASKPGKTLMINTINFGSCIALEVALAKCKNWVAVKKFVNKSSKNTITIWLSNNE